MQNMLHSDEVIAGRDGLVVLVLVRGQGEKKMSEEVAEQQDAIEIPDMYERLQILKKYKHIAVVGLSADQYRPSHFVAIYMQSEGYDIIPINPRYAGKTILGKRVYASLTEAKEAGEEIEIVDVFRKGEDTPPIADEAAKIGAKVLWLQLGVQNDEAGRWAHDAGLTFVQNRCVKIEHARFFGGLHTVGLNTGVILAKKLE
jgi:predicted CoA-binding protein